MQVAELQAWLCDRLPTELVVQPPQIKIYPDELLIILDLGAGPPAANAEEQQYSEQTMITQQREATRPIRIKLAKELHGIMRLPVAWGMRVGSSEMLFTTRTVPVMTRLGRGERDVLDTLVAAGVADTRSSALAYTVRAFAAEHADWLAEVRQAIEQVQQVRSRLKLSRRAGVPIIADSDDPANEGNNAMPEAEE